MKIHLEPIDVEPAAGRPRHIRWRRHRYAVEEVVDFWVWQGRWWSAEERRDYLQLSTDGGTLEIFRRDGRWMLSRIHD